MKALEEYRMDFTFHMPVKAFFGQGCLHKSKEELLRLGSRAFIVTGKSSGRSSGALSEVTDILREAGVAYSIYDEIANNPSLENVTEGGKAAAAFGADCIIGIGGGSPLDASKAIAVLAVNAMDAAQLYTNRFPNRPLPIAAVPTTAGTGSEVTPYSILTRHDAQTKMSFGNADTFPRVAFLDPRYTESLSREVTIHTAVDAFSHAVEGYVSNRSTVMSDALAVEAIQIFGKCLPELLQWPASSNLREKLLYASMLGGMVISHTGTTIVHGLGYSLTYFHGIPHGKANGLLLPEYLKFISDAVPQRIEKILQAFSMQNPEELQALMQQLLPVGQEMGDQDMVKYASLAMKQKSAGYNAKPVNEDVLQEIMRSALCRDV